MLIALEAMFWVALAATWAILVLGAAAISAVAFLACKLIRGAIWPRHE